MTAAHRPLGVSPFVWGVSALVRHHVKITSLAGVHAEVKAPWLVAGMAAGADSTDDMDVLRHGAMDSPFTGIRAPSTLESFPRSFTWGNVRQLAAARRVFLALCLSCPAACVCRHHGAPQQAKPDRGNIPARLRWVPVVG